MSQRLILAFSGFSGTGKSTLANYLEVEHDFFTFEGSSYLKVLAESEGIQLRKRTEYADYYQKSQHELGKSWLVDTMLRRPEKRLLNTGLRNRADYERIHSAGGLVIALTCPVSTCLDRIDTTNPKNPRNKAEYELHKMLDSSGTEDGYGLHTAWTVEHADITLDTSAPIYETFHSLSEIVAELEA